MLTYVLLLFNLFFSTDLHVCSAAGNSSWSRLFDFKESLSIKRMGKNKL